MTREEHLLMLTVFAKQQQLIQALANMLKSRDLATEHNHTFLPCHGNSFLINHRLFKSIIAEINLPNVS
jgi:hypothetical protein